MRSGRDCLRVGYDKTVWNCTTVPSSTMMTGEGIHTSFPVETRWAMDTEEIRFKEILITVTFIKELPKDFVRSCLRCMESLKVEWLDFRVKKWNIVVPDSKQQGFHRFGQQCHIAK